MNTALVTKLHSSLSRNFRAIECLGVVAILCASVLEFVYIRPLDRHIALHRTATTQSISNHYILGNTINLGILATLDKKQIKPNGEFEIPLRNQTGDSGLAATLTAHYYSMAANSIRQIAEQIKFARDETGFPGSRHSTRIDLMLAEALELQQLVYKSSKALKDSHSAGFEALRGTYVLSRTHQVVQDYLLKRVLNEGDRLIRDMESDKKRFGLLFTVCAWLGSCLLAISKFLNWRVDKAREA
jgi:hypothetical protein